MDLELVIDEGGGAFYGPEDLRAGPRRHRPDPADVDHPARLPDAPALRARVHRRRQRPAPPDHDPPGPVRLGRAVLRHPARALRRRPPHLARARAGPGARRCATTTTATPTRWPTGCRAAGPAGRRSTRPTRRSAARIRKAKLLKVPYILVVGDDDVAAGTVGVNRRGERPPRPGRGSSTTSSRRARRRDRRARACPKRRVTLEHLWAGWRQRVRPGGRAGAATPVGATDAGRRPGRLRLLPHRGQRAAVGRQRRPLAGRADLRRPQRLSLCQRATDGRCPSATSDRSAT